MHSITNQYYCTVRHFEKISQNNKFKEEIVFPDD